MTDSYIAFTVTLIKETRDDDAAKIINAIEMIRGVCSVSPVVSNANDHWAKESAKNELKEKLIDIFK